MSSTQNDYTNFTPEGEAIISLQNVEGNFIATWSGKGAVPLVGVSVKTLGHNMARIYVKVAQYTGFCMAFFTTNAFNRHARGIHFRLEKAYTKVSEEVAKELDAEEVTTFFQHWMGREQVGIGYNNNNQLLMRSQLVDTSKTGTSSHSLQVMGYFPTKVRKVPWL